MRKITVFMILIFMLFLTACGGGRVLSLGDSFEEDLGVNGRLEYTIKAARLGEMPVGAGGFLEDSHVTVDGVSYVYPDFLTNGALVSGARLVLLDIEVLNVDADNAGRYEEPYVFRADSIVTLADRSDKAGAGGYAYIDAGYFSLLGGCAEHDMAYELYIDAGYFSLLGGCAEHDMAYELKPGESVAFTLGFLVGSGRQLKDLYACTASGSADAAFVELGLS